MSDLNTLAVPAHDSAPKVDDFRMVPAMCQEQQKGLLGLPARSTPHDELMDNKRNPVPA